MSDFSVGQEVLVRCAIHPGPFEDEKLITLNTIHGPISGFLPVDELENVKNDTGFVPGIVLEIAADYVTIRLKGSFFTTNGIARLAPEEALAA